MSIRCDNSSLVCVCVPAPHPPDLVTTLLHHVGVAGTRTGRRKPVVVHQAPAGWGAPLCAPAPTQRPGARGTGCRKPVIRTLCGGARGAVAPSLPTPWTSHGIINRKLFPEKASLWLFWSGWRNVHNHTIIFGVVERLLQRLSPGDPLIRRVILLDSPFIHRIQIAPHGEIRQQPCYFVYSNRMPLNPIRNKKNSRGKVIGRKQNVIWKEEIKLKLWLKKFPKSVW